MISGRVTSRRVDPPGDRRSSPFTGLDRERDEGAGANCDVGIVVAAIDTFQESHRQAGQSARWSWIGAQAIARVGQAAGKQTTHQERLQRAVEDEVCEGWAGMRERALLLDLEPGGLGEGAELGHRVEPFMTVPDSGPGSLTTEVAFYGPFEREV